MTKEQLQKSLERVTIYCINKDVTRIGKINKWSIKKMMEVFEEVGIEKISGVDTYQEFKITKNKFSYYLEDRKINSFIGCDSICGYLDLSFKIRFQNAFNMFFKVNECLIIDFE